MLRSVALAKEILEENYRMKDVNWNHLCVCAVSYSVFRRLSILREDVNGSASEKQEERSMRFKVDILLNSPCSAMQ